MMDLIEWIVARGREPSTYAGLAVALSAFGIPDAGSWAKDLSMLAVGLFSVLAMIMKETGV